MCEPDALRGGMAAQIEAVVPAVSTDFVMRGQTGDWFHRLRVRLQQRFEERGNTQSSPPPSDLAGSNEVGSVLRRYVKRLA